MTDDEQWPADWLRGVLPLCVLGIVAEEESYGYAVAQRLQATGLGSVKGGTLYPVLTRLEQEGLLESTWREGGGGPGRKYYTVTDAGRHTLTERGERWRTFAERAGALLTLRGART